MAPKSSRLKGYLLHSTAKVGALRRAFGFFGAAIFDVTLWIEYLVFIDAWAQPRRWRKSNSFPEEEECEPASPDVSRIASKRPTCGDEFVNSQPKLGPE